MISIGENKSILCKGDFRPAQLYKGDKKIAGYITEEFEGIGSVTLESCYNDKLHNAVIHGNSIQDGTPTPETPVEVQSVGEKVTEEEYAGKYKVTVMAKCMEDMTQIEEFNIYLDEPLRKIGEYTDYIDFEKGVIVRNVRKRVFNGSESWDRHNIAAGAMAFRISTLTLPTEKVWCLCNWLEAKTWGFLYGNKDLTNGNYRVGIAKKSDYLVVCPYSTLPTLEEWKAQLQQWNEEGNPFTVWYVIATTETPIELPKLPQFKGTTIYEVDTDIPAKIEGKYKRTEVEQ